MTELQQMLVINAIVKYKDLILSENSHHNFTVLGDGKQYNTCQYSSLPSIVIHAVYFNVLMPVFGFYLPY
jgi:hypothetical protein